MLYIHTLLIAADGISDKKILLSRLIPTVLSVVAWETYSFASALISLRSS